MSLVGSEVSVSRPSKPNGSHESLASPADRTSVSEESQLYLSTPVGSDDENDDYHPSLSPPRPAEELFMGSSLLQGHSTISAAALAQQIHMNHLEASSRGTFSVATDDFQSLVSRLSLRAGSTKSSICTDDFHSACSSVHQTLSDPALSSLDDSEPLNSKSDSSIFERDALSRGDLYTSESPPEFHDTRERNMTDTPKIDPAEKIYSNAKSVWAWGKGVVVFSPFLGMAEHVAGKVVSMAGSSMEDVDTEVSRKLHDVDDGILNPAIAKIIATLMGAASSSEEFLKPIVMTLLKPLDFMIKNKAETKDPEVTTANASAPMSPAY